MLDASLPYEPLANMFWGDGSRANTTVLSRSSRVLQRRSRVVPTITLRSRSLTRIPPQRRSHRPTLPLIYLHHVHQIPPAKEVHQFTNDMAVETLLAIALPEKDFEYQFWVPRCLANPYLPFIWFGDQPFTCFYMFTSPRLGRTYGAMVGST